MQNAWILLKITNATDFFLLEAHYSHLISILIKFNAIKAESSVLYLLDVSQLQQTIQQQFKILLQSPKSFNLSTPL